MNVLNIGVVWCCLDTEIFCYCCRASESSQLGFNQKKTFFISRKKLPSEMTSGLCCSNLAAHFSRDNGAITNRKDTGNFFCITMSFVRESKKAQFGTLIFVNQK